MDILKTKTMETTTKQKQLIAYYDIGEYVKEQIVSKDQLRFNIQFLSKILLQKIFKIMKKL